MSRSLVVGALSDHDAVKLCERFLAEDDMPIVADAAGNVPDGVPFVEKYRQDLSSFHGLQFQLGLHEVVRTDHSAKVQFCIRLELETAWPVPKVGFHV